LGEKADPRVELGLNWIIDGQTVNCPHLLEISQIHPEDTNQ